MEVVSNVGCGSSTDDLTVKVYRKPQIPNSFSPNGDGVNDTWKLENIEDYPESRIEVFNRYGQKLFESRKYTFPWDGRNKGAPLPPGTYYYLIYLHPQLKVLSGWLLLVR